MKRLELMEFQENLARHSSSIEGKGKKE